MGKNQLHNILNSIRKSVETPYQRVLFALGIRHVGETVAKTLAAKFRTIDDLISATTDQLTGVAEIGPKIAASIVSYFSDSENLELIERLRSAGMKFSAENEMAAQGTSLSGKTIVISGVFIKHTRDEYKELIEKNGGKNSSSVSGSTSFILSGENMGESKKEKALSLGIPLIE